MSNEFVTVKRGVVEQALEAIGEIAQNSEDKWQVDAAIKAANPLRAALEHPGVDEWNLVHKAVCTAVEKCKNASGMHRKIDLMVNAVQITHDVMGTDTAPQPAQQAGESGLPERNCGMPAEQQGLFRKFEVRRVDGSDQPGGKHHGCRYFVLDVDHDQHAEAALTAYANACENTHPTLAADLREKWCAAPQPAQQERLLTNADIAECRTHNLLHMTDGVLNEFARAIEQAVLKKNGLLL